MNRLLLIRSLFVLFLSGVVYTTQLVYTEFENTETEEPDPPPVPGDPGAVPIDGGLGVLFAAGVGYGVRRIYKAKKSQD